MSLENENDFPVVITDEFDKDSWFHYYAPPLTQRDPLRKQRHINIRSFVNERRAIPINMLVMDGFNMYDLDGTTLAHFSQDVDAKIYAESNENWTFGKVGRQEDRNNWNGIKIECTNNATTISQSVISL